MDQELRRISLTWKIGGTFTAVMFILGIMVLAAAYHLTRNALRDQVDQRVLAISSNLSNAAAGPVVARDLRRCMRSQANTRFSTAWLMR